MNARKLMGIIWLIALLQVAGVLLNLLVFEYGTPAYKGCTYICAASALALLWAVFRLNKVRAAERR